jgi:thioredoxin reductase
MKNKELKMKTKVMIIGTGPYGIAIAYDLWMRKIPFVISGDPFVLWYNHTLDTMDIRSDWHTSEIFTRDNRFGFRDFLSEHYTNDVNSILKKRIPVDIFRHYLQTIEEKLPYKIENQLTVSVEKNGETYVSELEDGNKIESDVVVVASGIGPHKWMPEKLENIDHPKVLHSWDAKTINDWKDMDLLIIGGGQSAAENVIHLKGSNRIFWMLRKEPIFYSEPINLPTPVFNFVLNVSPYFYYLPKGLKAGFGNQYIIPTITPDLKEGVNSKEVTVMYEDANNLGLTVENEKIKSTKLNREFDGIIAATGFKYSIYNLDFLSQEIKESIADDNGIPLLDWNFETTQKGIYMVGGIAEPVYGPAQRFMMGAKHAALRVGKTMDAVLS